MELNELIIRSLQGFATPAEHERLRAWRRASSANDQKYRELESVWSLLGELHEEPVPPPPDVKDLLERACRDRVEESDRTAA